MLLWKGSNESVTCFITKNESYTAFAFVMCIVTKVLKLLMINDYSLMKALEIIAQMSGATDCNLIF